MNHIPGIVNQCNNLSGVALFYSFTQLLANEIFKINNGLNYFYGSIDTKDFSQV